MIDADVTFYVDSLSNWWKMNEIKSQDQVFIYIYILNKNNIILFSRTENDPFDKAPHKVVGRNVAKKQGKRW